MMADINQTPSRTDPVSFMQEQMQTYLASYQDLLRAAMENASRLQVGQDSWQRQMDYANRLLEASQMVVKATGDYVEKCLSQTATGWQKAAQATGEVLNQQDR